MSSRFRQFCAALLVLAASFGTVAQAQEFSALARVVPGSSTLVDRIDGGVTLTLGLTQPVVYRAFLADGPDRVTLQFRTVDWGGAADVKDAAKDADLTFEPARAGWSELSLVLEAPMEIAALSMTTQSAIAANAATLTLELVPVSQDVFSDAVEVSSSARQGLSSDAMPQPARRQSGDALIVALDPGHGGIDVGAEVDGVQEADLVLDFARELRAVLDAQPGVDVVMTRDADIFVPLPDRLVRARRAGADLFLSIHADSLAEGIAHGVSVYALGAEDGAAASAILAEREDRTDILRGVDLTEADDTVAAVLLDLARRETRPRSTHLSQALIDGLSEAGAPLNSNPTRAAHFAVLRSADMPSVLIELGFLSTKRDRDRMLSPEGRQEMIDGIALGLQNWAVSDAIEAGLLRR